MTVQWIPTSARKPTLPRKEKPNTPWLTRKPQLQNIRELARLRSLWFELYADGGGKHPTLDKQVSKADASKQVVQFSKWILQEIVEIGREPIAEGGAEFIMSPPEIDRHWINHQKQVYSLYLTRAELMNATQNTMMQRQVLLENIPIKELLDGHKPKKGKNKND